MNYLQKKKQAIIMMLAAQIIKTAEGYPLTVNDCENGAAVDYTVWGNTVTGKNLISYPYINTTKTVNGITFTDNGDGSITVNGTSTANAIFYLFRNNKSLINSLNIGDTFTASVTSDKTWNQIATMYLICNYYDSSGGMNSGVFVQNPDKGKTITISDSWSGMAIYLVVYKGKTIDNITVKPMIEKGETATEYESYTEKYVGDKTLVSDNTYKYKIPIVNSGDNDREDALISIYLDEPLKKGESVNFGTDRLPELQLFEGSNTITANTAVKPEKIVIDYYEKG